MNAFEQAWLLLKMPFTSGRMESDPDEVIDQPLYSGGDASDTPLYWTKDILEALRYALYGSAVLNDTKPENPHGYDRDRYPHEQDMTTFTPPPLRQTIPTIFRTYPPKDSDQFIEVDPQSYFDMPSYRNYMADDLPYDQVPDDEVLNLIQGYGALEHRGFTSGMYYPDDMAEKHVMEAIERLKNRQAGLLELPKDVEGLYGWSKTD